MIAYIIRRLLLAIVTIWAITVISLVIIQLPPGDFVDAYIAAMSSTGGQVSLEEAEALRVVYGLNKPIHVQYFKWMSGMAHGDFGQPLEWRRPVSEVTGSG